MPFSTVPLPPATQLGPTARKSVHWVSETGPVDGGAVASDSEATERGLRWSTPLTQYLEFGPQTLATERICDALALATPRIPPARAGCAQSGVFRNGAFCYSDIAGL